VSKYVANHRWLPREVAIQTAKASVGEETEERRGTVQRPIREAHADCGNAAGFGCVWD
jgi:hypothetical protein